MKQTTFEMMCKEFEDNIKEMDIEKRYSHQLGLASYNSAIASFMYAERLKDFKKFQNLSCDPIKIYTEKTEDIIRA